ncbi:MAG: hypothetical protein ACD_7C00513G0002 [uncultured bacterium]|nr:MAG: hypothetical protein ACD_7C00513G0002 [uncultured bacterium]HBR80007.1 hypothetical protein [Candidatus Moranbacteria bacterium]
MQATMKKIILMSLIFSLALGFSFGANATSVSYTPTVKIKKSADTYVTLQIVSTNLKKKDVKVKIKIEKIDADDDDTKIFEKTLNKSGKVDIKVDGLAKDNAYSFSVAIKKSSDSDYSDYSSEVSVNAEGTFDYNPALSIKDETSSTMVLDVTSTKLKRKKTIIKVKIENKDTDKTETRTFTKTLNKNGKAEITIDNLSKDTEYSIKALVKKSKDKGFSKYSNEESATTED